jgi:hypothetical protein
LAHLNSEIAGILSYTSPYLLAVQRTIAVATIVAAAWMSGALSAQSNPTADLIRAAAAYVAAYEREMSAIVSEESYEQVAAEAGRSSQRRRLRSDVLVIPHETTGWVVFRDVFEVDGKALRDRDDRLANLFLKPEANMFRQAMRIAEEGARYNLNLRGRVVERTLNNPMTALHFLRPPNLPRSRFRAERRDRVDDAETTVILFEEQSKPRVLYSRDEAAARGHFWIHESGRIMQTELQLNTRARPSGDIFSAMVKIKFAPDAKAGVLVPVSMNEVYTLGNQDSRISGKATYSNFRRFSVDVSTVIKPPGR